jgi:hypothetical protein
MTPRRPKHPNFLMASLIAYPNNPASTQEATGLPTRVNQNCCYPNKHRSPPDKIKKPQHEHNHCYRQGQPLYQYVFPQPGPIISTMQKEKSEIHKTRRYGCRSEYLIIIISAGFLVGSFRWRIHGCCCISFYFPSVVVVLFVFSARQ